MKKIKAVTAEEKVGEAGDSKKKRNKKKAAGPVRTGAIKVQKIAGFFEKGVKSTGETKSSESSSDLLQFSNERLKAYGVNPGQFKRKLKKEKFKNQSNLK